MASNGGYSLCSVLVQRLKDRPYVIEEVNEELFVAGVKRYETTTHTRRVTFSSHSVQYLDVSSWISYFLYFLGGVDVSPFRIKQQLESFEVLSRVSMSHTTFGFAQQPSFKPFNLPGFTPRTINAIMVLSGLCGIIQARAWIVPSRVSRLELMRTNLNSLASMPVQLRTRYSLMKFSTVSFRADDRPEVHFNIRLSSLGFIGHAEETAFRLYEWQMPSILLEALKNCKNFLQCFVRHRVYVSSEAYLLYNSVHLEVCAEPMYTYFDLEYRVFPTF